MPALCHLGKVTPLLHSFPPFPPFKTFTPLPFDFRATRSELSLRLLKVCVPGDDGPPESSVITLITALTHIHTSKKELRSLFFLSSPRLCPRSSSPRTALAACVRFQNAHGEMSELRRGSTGRLCLSAGSTLASIVCSDTPVTSPGQSETRADTGAALRQCTC